MNQTCRTTRHPLFFALVMHVAVAAYASRALGDPNVVYVDAGAVGVGNGENWVNAYTNVQDAIVAAQVGDEVWVAAGRYPGFQLRHGIAVYGGFAASETTRAQRNPPLNPTRIGDGLPGLDGHLVVASHVDATAVLDGFILTGGVAPDDEIAGLGGSGGGLFIDGGSPKIVGCSIVANRARLGSGVMVIDGSPTFTNCDISLNTSARSGEGTGIYAMTTGAPTQLITLVGCTVNANTAIQGHFATGNGAGIYCGAGVDLSVSRCTLNWNFTAHNQSFGNATTGGAISFHGAVANITDSIFMQNVSAFGAGVYAEGALTCVNCAFIGNRAVTEGCAGPECNGAPDLPSGYGGGVYAGNATLIGCTFHANWAAKTGAGVVANGTVQNSILWGNVTYPVCCGEDPLPPPRDQIDGGITISHSCIQGLLEPIPGEDPPNPADFPGSIDIDPGFMKPYVVSSFGYLTAIGDIHLGSGSPAIDAGDNTAVPPSIATDLGGLPRFFDDPATPDTGDGTAPVVDMGAHEFRIVIPGDTDYDSDVDTSDYAVFSTCFGGPNRTLPPSGCTQIQFDAVDLDADGAIGLKDFALFQEAFTGSRAERVQVRPTD